MPKKVKYQVVQPDPPSGPTFGQVLKTADHNKAQVFAHQHVEVLARDTVVGACAETLIFGFDGTLPGGLVFRLLAPGHIIEPNGKSYEIIDEANIDLVISAADPSFPRIDLVVATIADDVDAADELRPFLQLRTQAELDAGVAPYSPTQFNQPTEQHTSAVVSLKAGTPDAMPVAPVLAANERALYSISVPAGSTSIKDADVSDLRTRVGSLCVLQDRIDVLEKDINTRQPNAHRHPALQVDIGPGAGVWENKTVQEFINAFAQVSDDEIVDPIIRPETLATNGILNGVADVDGTVPVVDLPIGVRVAFSDVVRTVEKGKFPAVLNAREVNKSAGAGTETRDNTVNLSLAAINSIESDGGGDWTLLSPALPSGRATWPIGRFACARDDNFIEIMGGNPPGGTDWYTFDTSAQTVTQRNFSGTVPTFPIVFCVSCGDGTVLMATFASAGGGGLKWFLVDAATGVTVELAGGANAPITVGTTAAWGELIAENQVFIILASGNNDHYYLYHVDTGDFELFVPLGQGPDVVLGQTIPTMDVCLYKPGQALIVQKGDEVLGLQAKTIVFDLSSRSFTTLAISQPEAVNFNRLTLVNANGRAQLVTAKGSGNAATENRYYEITPSASNPFWRKVTPTNLPIRLLPAATSLLREGLPQGKAFFFGGRNAFTGQYHADIWQFAPGGVIQTTFEGQPALTLAPGVSQASFRVTDFPITWGAVAIARVVASLVGSIPAGSVRLSYSFDGTNFIDVIPNRVTEVLNSDAPPTRLLRITLISAGSAANPILSSVAEHFEQVGGPGFNELVLRYDVPAGTQALYIARDGTITVSAVISPTTIDKAILIKSTHNGAGNNATLKKYRNKRRLRWFYTGTKPAGQNGSFNNDLAVAPEVVKATATKGGVTGDLYRVAAPAVAFDQDNVQVAGLLTTGDGFEVEVWA
jgi:hypothetical protein